MCGSESVSTWLDRNARNISERWKAATRNPDHDNHPMSKWSSADGERWWMVPQADHRALTGKVMDRAAFYFDPFRSKWIFSIRDNLCSGSPLNANKVGHMRISRYWEGDSFAASSWSSPFSPTEYFACRNSLTREEPMPWVGADLFDCQGKVCDLYHVDAVAYESLMVGTFAFFYYSIGSPNLKGPITPRSYPRFCKRTELHLGFSRDGFHWSRADQTASANHRSRTPFTPNGEQSGLWYQQPVAGNFIVVGDEIYVYYGGINCSDADPAITTWMEARKALMAHNRSAKVPPLNWTGSEVTALAVLRRDGFASLAPPLLDGSQKTAIVLTRSIIFTQGSFLFVNVDALQGELTVGVLRKKAHQRRGCEWNEGLSFEGGKAECGLEEDSLLALDTCVAIRGVNSTKHIVSWGAGSRGSTGPLGHLQNKPVHLQFVLRGSVQLFSFWVSDSTGESGGYMGGGGPGFANARDQRAFHK